MQASTLAFFTMKKAKFWVELGTVNHGTYGYITHGAWKSLIHTEVCSRAWVIRPDLLNVLLLEPGGSKFFHFQKKSRDWINTRTEASSQMARLWLSMEVVSGCTVLFGSRIINCFQEDTFGNFLSRLEEDKFSESDFLFLFFYRATQVYFVIKLARATKHQVVGLA